MRGLRLCCKGIGYDINLEAPETKEKIVVPDKTESCVKPRNASVIPPKRKCVKKMVCTCFLQCICDKCLNNNNYNNTQPKTKALYGQANYGN